MAIFAPAESLPSPATLVALVAFLELFKLGTASPNAQEAAKQVRTFRDQAPPHQATQAKATP